jgi:deoxyribodipyrimidine photolyase
MRSRGVRRRKHKQLRHLLTLHERQRLAVANQLLTNWQAEARRRAKWLGAPAVWRLTTDPHIQAVIRELDPTGDLLADLRRVCAEVIAQVVDRLMIQSCLPRTVRAAH